MTLSHRARPTAQTEGRPGASRGHSQNRAGPLSTMNRTMNPNLDPNNRRLTQSRRRFLGQRRATRFRHAIKLAQIDLLDIVREIDARELHARLRVGRAGR